MTVAKSGMGTDAHYHSNLELMVWRWDERGLEECHSTVDMSLLISLTVPVVVGSVGALSVPPPGRSSRQRPTGLRRPSRM